MEPVALRKAGLQRCQNNMDHDKRVQFCRTLRELFRLAGLQRTKQEIDCGEGG